MSLDIETGVAEARTLHPSSDGYFAVLRKNPVSGRVGHHMYRLGRIESVVNAMAAAPDSYISQASFVSSKSRTMVHMKAINCAFVDIDCYKDGAHGDGFVPDEAFVQDLLANARAAGLPEPSYVTYSGRGVYCKWIFDKPVHANQLLRWEMLQNVLVPLYTAFGVDAAVRDVSRVLRVMGSTNAASGSVVTPALNNNVRYSFDALCAAAEAVDVNTLIWPTKTATEVKGVITKVARAKKKLSQANIDDEVAEHPGDMGILERYSLFNQPFMPKFGTGVHLNWSRFVDLRDLMQARGGIRPGVRDLTLFWMANFLAHSRVVTSATLLPQMETLLGAFSGRGFDPIADGSLGSLKKRLELLEAGKKIHFNGGEYDPLYRPTNDHLIDVLEISASEQLKLGTLIGGAEKLRRADAKTPGRAERREARIEWRALARRMASDLEATGASVNITEIATATGVDKARISRLLSGKLDRDPNSKIKETRGRKKSAFKDGRRIVIQHGAFSKIIWVKNGQSEREAIAQANERKLPGAVVSKLSDSDLRAPRVVGGSRLSTRTNTRTYTLTSTSTVPSLASKPAVHERIQHIATGRPFSELAKLSTERARAGRAAVQDRTLSANRPHFVPIRPPAAPEGVQPVPTREEIQEMVAKAQRECEDARDEREERRRYNEERTKMERLQEALKMSNRIEEIRKRVMERAGTAEDGVESAQTAQSIADAADADGAGQPDVPSVEAGHPGNDGERAASNFVHQVLTLDITESSTDRSADSAVNAFVVDIECATDSNFLLENFMATSAAERLEKARQAKAAKAAGTESAFIEKSRQEREAAAALAPAPAPAPRPAAAQVARPASSSPFSALAARRSTMDDDYADQAEPEAVIREAPALVPASIPAPVLVPAASALPSSIPTRLSSPAAGQPVSSASEPSLVGSPAESSSDAIGVIQPRYADLAAKSNKLRIQMDAEEANLPSRRGPAAAPVLDPDPVWESPTLPAGSDFNEAEWEAAREGDKYHVFEVRSGSEGSLFQAERAPQPTVKTSFVKGVVVQSTTPAPYSADHIEPLYGELFDGCLLLGPKATTTHPNATVGSGRLEMRLADGAKWPYKIVRPASQAETHGWLATVKGWIDLKGAAPGKLALMPSVVPQAVVATGLVQPAADLHDGVDENAASESAGEPADVQPEDVQPEDVEPEDLFARERVTG